MPNFKAGSHDRVFSSQLNGAVTLTDPTTMLINEYKHGENILFYDLKDIDAATFIVDENLKDLDKLKKIAQKGYEIASNNHTWTNIAEKLLSAI